MDRDGDGVVTPAELEASQAAFRALVEGEIVVTADGTRCAPTLEGGGDVEGDGFGLSMTFACATPPRSLVVSMDVLRRLLPGHRHILRVQAPGASVDTVLTGASPRADVSLAPAIDRSEPTATSSLRGAARLGVEHILTGWDHLLFLFALLLGTRGIRHVAIAVSAFTVAHSITLALAVFDVVALSPRIVEPAIAASIAYVAFENALRPDAPHRWRSTFAFGLVHGLGFAGALRGLALARERLLPTLLGFNVGVELGQLLVVAAVVPFVAFALRARSNGAAMTRATSIALGVVGLAVLFVRIAFPS
jgi:hypothetical protein